MSFCFSWLQKRKKMKPYLMRRRAWLEFQYSHFAKICLVFVSFHCIEIFCRGFLATIYDNNFVYATSFSIFFILSCNNNAFLTIDVQLVYIISFTVLWYVIEEYVFLPHSTSS